MCAILMILDAELRHGVSTEVLGLLGGLIRIALPSVDVMDQIKLHLTIWSLPAARTVRRISETVDRFR